MGDGRFDKAEVLSALLNAMLKGLEFRCGTCPLRPEKPTCACSELATC